MPRKSTSVNVKPVAGPFPPTLAEWLATLPLKERAKETKIARDNLRRIQEHFGK